MMSRSDWLKLDERVNRAAYIAFTPEQKYLFWRVKISEVMSLGWNKAEIKHLELLYNAVSDNPRWFTNDFSKNEVEWEEFELFEYRWLEYAKDNLGWGNYLIGSIVASGNKLLDINGKLQIMNNSMIKLRADTELPICECASKDDWCINPFTYCGKNGSCPGFCKQTYDGGCGWLLKYICDGMC